MPISFFEFLHLGGFHWRNQPNPAVALFFRLFGPLGTMTRIRTARLLQAIEGVELTEKRVLDVGMGLGYVLFYLANKYPQTQFEGIDIDSERVKLCRKIALEEGICNVLVHNKRVEDLPLEPKFDIIFNADVLEHVDNDVGMLQAMASLLREGGRLVIHVPLRHQMQRRIFPMFKDHIVPDHVRDEYTEAEIVTKVQAAGLKVLQLYYGFGWLGELSMELNNLFWKWPVLRTAFALLTFPIAILAGFLDGKLHLDRGNAIIIVASHATT